MRYSKFKVGWLRLGAGQSSEAEVYALAQAERQRQATRLA